jgi:PhzF family phenazine biosynthesis protein
MQAIAREFNYSEQTFVLPPEDPAHTARVRIFTPVAELPFAGHPNVERCLSGFRGAATTSRSSMAAISAFRRSRRFRRLR